MTAVELYLHGSYGQTYQSLVAFSSFFMMEKMNTAEMTQRAMRILHSTQRGRPPQSMPMMETM